ncbi:hypothetical protein NQ317_014019 [Molorchus minor]|uniref:Uncharacterized protein n=1 Tax=Molorchus minor TaxID=1323400 RepID=A0ABQ9IV79_9CUCU|nr:hypothetical protein NQ317_014019 [Molorchus minor]
MTTINQKEYLKKYLGINKAPGEKKKKKKIRGDRLKIIDDDANGIMSQEIKEDLAADNEDTPQIVAVIDDRPPSMRIDEQTKNNLWQPIGENYSSPNETKTLKLLSGFKINKFKSSEMQDSQKSQIGIAERQSRTQIKCDRELSTMQEIDYSPPRKSIKVEQESPRRKESAEDHSPIRKTKTDNSLLRKERSSPYKKGNIMMMVTIHLLEKGLNIPPLNEEDRDYSPLRRDKRKRQSRWKSRSPDASPKRSTTLDGKKAGLQNAKDLVKETVLLKQKEEQLFQSMPEELSGKSAATVVREKRRKSRIQKKKLVGLQENKK